METEKKETLQNGIDEQSNSGPSTPSGPRAVKKDSFWQRLSLRLKVKLFIGILTAGAVLAAGGYIACQLHQNNDHNAQVLTVSALEEIVNVSDLNTYTAVYNGIAKVANEKNPEETDYYVSYRARVKAGLDFSGIQYELDAEGKTVKVLMPELQINEVLVDIESMDFIFYNKARDKSSVSEEAYKACVADAETESADETAILELAQENAENIVTALAAPIVKVYDPAYEVSIEWGQNNG